MQPRQLYRSLAEVWAAEPDADLEEEVRSTAFSLLNWLLVLILNEERPPAAVKEWLDEGLAKAKTGRKGDVDFFRLVRWASLAAAQEVLGDFGEKAAQEAVEWIVPASKKAKLPRERTELATCVLGLLSYFEGDDAITAWRDKQLQQEWQEGTQLSTFQGLYLADPSSAEDDLDLLSFETAHVCALLIDNLPGKYVAGLVLGLARRARERKRHVGSALAAGVRAFADMPLVTVEGPDFVLDEKKGELSMVLELSGEGKVEPLSFLFPQMLAGFTRELRSFLADVAEGTAGAFSKKAVLAVVKNDDATIAVVLRHDPSKTQIPKTTREGLARRLQIADAHARTFESKLRAKVILRVEEQTA